MKVMVCGKGGTGKTVLTVLMARLLSEKYRVYIIDSDESNVLLPAFLGVDPPKPLIEYVGGKKDEEVLEKISPDIARILSRVKEGIRLNLLPPEYLSISNEGIGLIIIGKVREYGEGCACPFNILTRILLGNLYLEGDEIVLVDTDAGVEHVGRRLEEVSDGIISVIDPTIESLELSLMLKNIAKNLGKKFWVIANKVTEETIGLIMEEAAKMGLEIDGIIRFDKELYTSCLRRSPLKSSLAISDLRKFVEKYFGNPNSF
ncbi:MAG: ATP-binding protein [Candidatus Bathyarchaeia archaeon]